MSDLSTAVSSTLPTKGKPACQMKNESHVFPNDSRKSNRVMSYIIPPLLVATAAFSTYVWFAMCIEWFINNGHRRTGVCLIVFQIILLCLMGTAFFQITFRRAGYVPNRADRARFVAHTTTEANQEAIRSTPWSTDITSDDPPEKTYDRKPTIKEIDKFFKTAKPNDLPFYIARSGEPVASPRYCSICDVVKHDRVHHCSEVNRCVRKFDHFCPWVGGPLGHTRYKFFFQFITYVALYCVYMVVTFGVAIAQRRSAARGSDASLHIPANPGLWYACTALSGLFALLMVPFSAFHGKQIAMNQTTIESIDTRQIEVQVKIKTGDTHGLGGNERCRVILEYGANPFDLGIWQNCQQVLGTIVLDKWLPFRVLNWLLPLCLGPGDGLVYPYSETARQKLHDQAEKMSGIEAAH